MEDADKIKKTIGRPEVKEIIEFIKENPGTTTQKVVDQLKHEKIPASRLTTLAMIDKLVQLDVVKDDRVGSYSHVLRYNENYNWENLAMTLLADSLDEVKNAIYGLSFDDRANELMDKLQKMMDKLRVQNRELEKLAIQNEELPKQLEQPIIVRGAKASTIEAYNAMNKLKEYEIKAKAKRTRKRKHV
jgi:hypothetical protein